MSNKVTEKDDELRIQVGLDIGNMNVDVVGNTGREQPIKKNISAYTGSVVFNEYMDNGEAFRQMISYSFGQYSSEPFELNVGQTAEKESFDKKNERQKGRYWKDTDTLSKYFVGLSMYGIAMIIESIEKRHDKKYENIECVLTIAIPHNHVDERLIRALEDAFVGNHSISTYNSGQWNLKISDIEIRSQLFFSMASQYVRFSESGDLETPDNEWITSACGIIDVGSLSFQMAKYEPLQGVDGKTKITATASDCQDMGMWSAIPILKELVRRNEKSIPLSLSDKNFVEILQTGKTGGISFKDEQEEAIEMKASQLLGYAKNIFGSGQDLKKIGLNGRGFKSNIIEDAFKEYFEPMQKLSGLDIYILTDDNGNPDPGSSVANGAWKRALQRRFQPQTV